MFKSLAPSFSIHWQRLFFYGLAGTVFYAMVLSSTSDLFISLKRKEPIFLVWGSTYIIGGRKELKSLSVVRYSPKDGGQYVVRVPLQTKVLGMDKGPTSVAQLSHDILEGGAEDLGAQLIRVAETFFSPDGFKITYYLLFEDEILNSWDDDSAPWGKVQSLYRLFIESKSNFSNFEKVLACMQIKDLDLRQLHTMELPGRARGRYWIPDTEIRQTVQLLWDGRLEGEKKAKPMTSQLAVEVLNASGRKNVALEVTRMLRRAGFDVINWGNYSQILSKTVVNDLKGNIQEAHEAARLISPAAEVYTKIDEKSLMDIVILVGQDYQMKGEEN